MKSPENQPPRGMTLEATFGDGKRPTPASRNSGGRNGDQNSSGLANYFAWPGRICLLLAVVISPWYYGSVNFVAQMWIAISLLAGLGFWWFESSLNSGRKQILPLLFFPLALGILLGLFQLAPLPESLSGLLGRQVEIQQEMISSAAANSSIATASASISVNPDGTLHHLRLLFIALAAMLLGSRYFRTKQDIVIFLTTLTANGVAISFFGIVHSLTSNGKMFWVREITLGGQPFGPFVNRNNACCYLLVCLAAAVGLLPILLAKGEQSNAKKLASRGTPKLQQMLASISEFVANLNARKIAILLSIMLIGTGIIVSISRGGTGAMLIGGMVSLIAYGMARQPKNSLFVFIPLLLLAGLSVGFLTLGNALSDRLTEMSNVEIDSDLRFTHWASTWPATNDFGVLGSGLGTYRGVHRSYRQSPENVVFHYAENQFFQGLVEAGWPGLIIYLVAWLLVFQSANLLLSRGQSPTSIGVGLMGIFLISSQAFASFWDFGFYIPANTLVLAVTFGFLSYHAQALGGRLKKPSWLRLQVPSVVISTIVLVLFGVTCLITYSLYQRSAIARLCTPRIALVTRENFSLEQTEKRLDELVPRVKNTPTPEGLNYAAGLLIHRCRLQIFDAMIAENEVDQVVAALGNTEAKAEARQQVTQNFWNSTQLIQLQEHVNFLKSESRIQLNRFRAEPGLVKNLPVAKQLLEYSRKISPLQPFVHLRLAKINTIFGNTTEADLCIERALAVAPMNPAFRKTAGIYYLQSNRPELAAEEFRKLLELQPSQYYDVMDIATGRANRSVQPMSPDLIYNSVLPDDPSMLYRYAATYQIANLEDKNATLERAANLLEVVDFRNETQNILLGDIRNVQGEYEKALLAYNDYLLIIPHNEKYLYKRALLLEKLGKFGRALEDAERLADRATEPAKYVELARKLRVKISDQERGKQ